MWSVKVWQAYTLAALRRFAEAEAATDESLSLLPSNGSLYSLKALVCLEFGRHDEARRHIETTRRLGWSLEQIERGMRRVFRNSPTLQADFAKIRPLFAALEHGA
jgi:tetratricopeptide (TPR) repeat protein